MLTYLYLVQIVLAIALIAGILLQARGAGLGRVFGGEPIHKTRRGVEKTLFNATIGLAVAFFLVSLVIVALSK